ncbi:MAG: Ribosomal protein [Candidatus Parcubacteria bacterium]|nr:Ribosomal protein [Candidatus Parcubacteria bacterium]
MDENIREDRVSVYEIGYLIAGVPEERVSAEVDAIKGAIAGIGAAVIADEAPRREGLAYTIRKKNVSGSYEKHDEAYFGWVKFEAVTDKVEGLKKTIEAMPSVLRMLMITTVKEATYLGKHAPAVTAAAPYARRPITLAEAPETEIAPEKDAAAAIPATVEEMDKSIDDMVKEV